MKNLIYILLLAGALYAGYYFFVKKKKTGGGDDNDKDKPEAGAETYGTSVNWDEFHDNISCDSEYYVHYQLDHKQGRTDAECIKNGVLSAIDEAHNIEPLTHRFKPEHKKILYQTIIDKRTAGWTIVNAIKEGVRAIEDKVIKL